MRKAMMISALALAMAGCAAQQQGQAPQVRDLSASRERAPASHYTVETGDTLYGIAWRHNMDYRDLARLNRIGPPYQIQPGQRLVLDAEGPGPARDEGVTAVASTPGVVATPLGGGQPPADVESGSMEWLLPDGTTEQGRRLSAQSLDEADGPTQVAMEGAMEAAGGTTGPGPIYDATTPGADGSPAPDRSSRSYTPVDEVNWRWPADGEIVGRFGEGGSITAGIDIAGQKGQPVRAAGPGIVVYAGSGVRGYGNLILLKHNDEYLSAYAHNDSLRVRENDVVEAGEVIATMGDSDAEDVRLHFEVRKNGQPQDPLNYLPSR
ncbi:peptidoglycan DD-metalloendopeptidase family protein [Halomonas alkalicola]|uniref:Peptidoglycan DD-metalloendopeptidase family protein n=1 Tax=Halomonas alkalicola TaxID=1930622 RepID=A0ABY9H325_9GAMM|nr:peptidoglycan DD-metalloendopeptidase family protein [Halomonas alkalicola]WLI72871.1 peptidoglycan DD-metalloendopeptidase family protein [Halomonas alkalicola]